MFCVIINVKINIVIKNCYYLPFLHKTLVKTKKHITILKINNIRENELREIDIKSYFHDMISNIYFNSKNIKRDKRSCKDILIYLIEYKVLDGVKSSF